MASIRVSVDGLSRLNTNIKQLSANLQNRLLKSAVIAGAKVVVRAAKANAPIDTGALRKSIKNLRDKQASRKGYEVQAVSVFKIKGGTYGSTRSNKRKGIVGSTYQHDPPTFYWKFNELGTVKQPARPFIQPALSQNIPAVTAAIRDKLAEGLFKALQ